MGARRASKVTGHKLSEGLQIYGSGVEKMKKHLILIVRAGLSAMAQLAGTALAQGVNPTVSDGRQNTAGGSGALQTCFNTVPELGCLRNTAFGFSALSKNSSGQVNTGTGNFALRDNTTARFNTATGALALQLNISGTGNTATGVAALLNNNGDFNTATGFQALDRNTTGDSNTATGS